MYVYQCLREGHDFNPAEKESVVDVGWFKPAQADKVIKHRSLRPLMRRLLRNSEPLVPARIGTDRLPLSLAGWSGMAAGCSAPS